MSSAMAYAEGNLLKPEGRVHTGCLVMPMRAGDSCRWGSVHLTDQADSQVATKLLSQSIYIHLPFHIPFSMCPSSSSNSEE